MKPELLQRLRGYCEAVAIAKRLLKSGLIEYAEFLSIEEKIAGKYGFSEHSVFREIT